MPFVDLRSRAARAGVWMDVSKARCGLVSELTFLFPSPPPLVTVRRMKQQSRWGDLRGGANWVSVERDCGWNGAKTCSAVICELRERF